MRSIADILLRRFFSTVLVLFGVSVLIFFIARIIPGDPARIALDYIGPEAAEVVYRPSKRRAASDADLKTPATREA